MIESILRGSVHRRGFVMGAVLAMAAVGVYSFQKLLSTPYRTHECAGQINTSATGYSPVKQNACDLSNRDGLAVLPTFTIPSPFAMAYAVPFFRDGTDSISRAS